MDSEAVAKREHDIVEAIFTMVDTTDWATKFSTFSTKGDFLAVG
jgi:hypothetical protein